MSISTRLLHRAIELSKSGKKEDARHLLWTLLQQDPRNESAWIWYIDTFTSEADRIQVLKQFLEIFPNHSNAQKVLISLLQEQKTRLEQEAITQARQNALRSKKQPSCPAAKKSLVSGTSLAVMAVFIVCLISAIIVANLYTTQRIEALTTRLNTLNNNYNTLTATHRSLQTNYESLQMDNNSLQTNYDSLKADYDTALKEYDYLKSIAIVPPYISSFGRSISMAFNRTDGNLMYWDFSFDWLEYHILRGDYERKIMWNTGNKLTLKTQAGDVFSVVDMRDFVDTGPFKTYIPELYAKTGGGDAFIQEVWYMVTNLTTYVSEDDEIPRFPMETLAGGGGDCEDTSILYISMILAAPTDWTVKFTYMDTDNLNDPQKSNHVIPFIDTGSRTYLINTTSNTVMEPYPEGVRGWFYEVTP
jgi:hypothetical protein